MKYSMKYYLQNYKTYKNKLTLTYSFLETCNLPKNICNAFNGEFFPFLLSFISL